MSLWLLVLLGCTSGKSPGDTHRDTSTLDTNDGDTSISTDTWADTAGDSGGDTSAETGTESGGDSGTPPDTALDTSSDTSDTGVDTSDTGGETMPVHDEGNVGTRQYVKIAANWVETYALTLDGELDCWGWDCDDAVIPEGPFVDVCAGGGHGCALSEDGEVTCWAYVEASVVDEVPTGVATAITCGEGFSCIVTEEGSPYCWGLSDDVEDYGQVADTQTELTGVVDVSAGYHHACALTDVGEAYCWGSDYAGESDDMEGPYQFVAAGDFATCGILEDNTVDCWGSNSYFYSGILEGKELSLIDGSATGLFGGVQTSGELFCWRGYDVDYLPNEGGDYIDVTAGLDHWCALDVDGFAHCWGESAEGADIPP